MTNSLRSVCYLLAPCLALGAFALYLSRRPRPAPLPVLYGPLQFSVQGVEAQKILPANVYEGYDRRFQMVFQASGARPRWWGQSVKGATGDSIKGWKFWLQRGAQRTAFQPTKSLLWTTRWDDSKKRYTNDFSLHCGKIPTDASLKVSGNAVVDLSKNSPPFKASLPFEITLKKAGEQWTPPQFSTDPHLVIRKIEIRRPRWGRTVAAVTVLSRPGTDLDPQIRDFAQILTTDWQPYFYYSGSKSFDLSFGGDSGLIRKPTERINVVEFQWVNAEIQQAPARDLIIAGNYANSKDWPLEIAFAIKKNGKSVFGIVPPLTRPTRKMKD